MVDYLSASDLETPELDLLDGLDFYTPFSPSTTAGITTATRTNILPISLGGRDYVIDLKQYKRQSLNPFRQAQDPSREPGEQTLTVEGVWKRTQYRWGHGSGLEFADDQDADRDRYYQSEHIDVWTPREASLLIDTESKRTGTHSLLAMAGLYVYAWDGTDLVAAIMEDAGDMSVPVWVDQTLTGTASSIATEGNNVYVATGAGGIRVLTVGTPGDANQTTHAFDHVWFVNGWMLAADGEELFSVASAVNTQTSVYVHRNPSWRWISATAAPNAIYVLGTNSIGTRTEIYRITVKEDGSALNVPVFSGDLPNGEVGKCIYYYQSRVMIGTDKGARFAAIGNNGELAIGPLIDDPGSIDDWAAYGRYVYGAGNPGLWRFDLSNESETLVPAYAPDLDQPSTLSLNPDMSLVVATSQGLLFQGVDLYGPHPVNYCPEGYLRSGWYGMGSPERKVLSSGSVRTEPLPGDGFTNASVELAIEDDAENNTILGTLDEPGTRDPGNEWGGQGVDSELLRTVVTLRAPTAVETPKLRRVTIRVIPAPIAVEEILVPILMAGKVTTKGGQARETYDTYDEYQFFKSLEDSRQVVNYREGQVTYRVTVRGVSMESPEKWADKYRFFEGIIVVRLITEQGIPPTIGS